MARLIEEHPVPLAVGGAVGAVAALVCWRVGQALLADGPEGPPLSGPAEWVAWPGGMFVPLAGGALALGLLLIPDRRLDGRVRGILARLAVWGAMGFAVVQLLDDHMLDHPGNANPTGLAIPSPYQDYLSLVGLLALIVAVVGGLLRLPVRAAHAVARRRERRAAP